MAGENGRRWWETRPTHILLILCAAIPLLWPTVPPLTDLPGHIGRYAVQLDRATSPTLQAWYGFEWRLIGNLGVDMLVQLFAPLFGLEPSVKAIAIAIPMLQVAGFLAVAHEVHGRVPATALFALPLAYAYPFQFGFLNFSLAMALAFLALAFWLRLARMGRLWLRATMFVPLSILLWACHLYGWASFGVLAGSAELIRQRQAGKTWVQSAGATFVTCLVLTLPIIIMLASPDGQTGSGPTQDWFNWSAKQTWLILALRDRWMGFDIASVGLMISIIVASAALFILKSVRRDNPIHVAALALPALLFALLFILMPRIIFGSAYADMRMVPIALATALLSIRPLDWANRTFVQLLALTGLSFFAARIAGTTVSFIRYDQSIGRELVAISHIPRQARLITFVGRPCKEDWSVHRLDHLPGLALARRHAFANDQWDLAGAQLLSVKYEEAGKFDNDPSQFVTERKCERFDRMWFTRAIQTFPRGAFDYLWVVGAPDDPAVDLSGLQPIWQQGRSSLYRIVRPVSPTDMPASR